MNKPVALIVEDDRDIVALFRHVLDIAGYHTEIVLNGKEAMERLGTFQPNIVLLDLQLPGLSGIEILTRMRADDRLKNVPVVVITAYAPYASSLPVEPDLLLLKPVDINQLSNLVQRLQVTRWNERTGTRCCHRVVHPAFFYNTFNFSLERIKQSEFRRFGVLFADLAQFNELKRKMNTSELNELFRHLGDQFKAALRPTDTMAWSSRDEFFLTLIEEIPSPEAHLRIARRVKDGMRKFLENADYGLGLRALGSRANVGVLLCDSEYEDVQQIMSDIDIARGYLREGLFTNPCIFDREMLKKG